MKLLLVQDVGLVRDVVAALASEAPGTLDVRSASGLAEAEAMLAHDPAMDLALVDLDADAPAALVTMQRLNAIAARTAFVAVAADVRRGTVIGAINAGASGFIAKDDPLDTLKSAVGTALAGGIPLPAPILERRGSDRPGYGTWTPTPRSAADLGFTDAQAALLRLLVQGKSAPVIGQLLGLPDADVATGIAAVQRQLSADSRIQAVLSAARSGLRFGKAPGGAG